MSGPRAIATVMMTMQVTLSEPLAQKIREREINGQGGFQSFARELQQRLSGRSLELDDDFRERLEHYAFDFGRGGWQTFLREIVAEIEQTRPEQP